MELLYVLCISTHQCIPGEAPSYLRELLTPQTSTRALRSASVYLLKPPRTKLPTMGDCASCSAAPRLCNALVDHLRTPQTVDALKPTFLGELISLNFSLLLFFFFFSNLHALQVFILLACSLPVSCSTSGFV